MISDLQALIVYCFPDTEILTLLRNPDPIIVYPVARYRGYLSHFMGKCNDLNLVLKFLFTAISRKPCRKKCTGQSLKVLWVVSNALYFKEIWKNGKGGGRGKDICLRVLKESKALRLWLRVRREGRAKMSDVPAETGNGLWESLKCAGRPYLGSITSRYFENELGLAKQRKSSLMCTYHYSISVRLDSNINLLVKLGSVVRLKPDLLTLGMRAKLANFACDFRIHVSRISEKKNAINS